MFRLLITLILATLAGGAARGAEVTFREIAEPSSGGLVLLGDVATIRGSDAARLSTLPLMPKPAPGAGQLVSAQAVREMLSAQGESPSEHRFGGAYFVRVATPATTTTGTASNAWRAPAAEPTPARSNAFRVRRGGDSSPVQRRVAKPRPLSPRQQSVVEAMVIAAIQRTINEESTTQRLAVRSVQLTATAVRELAGLDAASMRVRLPQTEALSAGQTTVRVGSESSFEGEAFRVVVDLLVQPMRLVASAAMPRDALIVASMVRSEPVPVDEIDRPQSLGYTDLDQVVGREAKRPLRVGEVLSDTNTAPPLMVQRGEEVTVASGGGGISVRVRAVAKQDGRQGELVPVETFDLEEKFMARVVGPRRLSVLSAGPAVTNFTRSGGLR